MNNANRVINVVNICLLKPIKSSFRTVLCSQLRRKLCRFIYSDNQIIGANGFKYNIKDQYNCKTSNVVYAINCINCPGKLYIGEMGQSLRKRINSHRSDIMCHCKKLVANHFISVNHSLDNLKVAILIKI